MKPTVMLVGVGDLGGVILELLAREDWPGRIVAADRNAERGVRRCNLARIGAYAQGCQPEIAFLPLDLSKGEAVAEAVDREQPDLVLSTASLMTWWFPELLPEPQASRIKSAGFGVWLPVHLTLSLKLMEALRDAAYDGHAITAPFPDVVNCILGKLGLAPTCGVGNLDEIVPKIRLLAGARLGVPPQDVDVALVAHHALEPVAFGEPAEELPPYFLRIEHDGRDVTGVVRAKELLLAPYELPGGPATHFLTAGSTVRLMRALVDDDETYLHAPAPNGLPGGYPVLASKNGVRPAPIKGLSLEEAIAINERSHRFDGIERIENDGTAVFVGERAGILRDELGYDCERLEPHAAETRANELIARFREYAQRHGAKIPTART
jgi:hypothetical protein